MQQEESILFNILKQEIVAVMKRSYPGISADISDRKGQEIIDFQEELQAKVNGHLSEKWFYSHFKNSNHKLPRIDVLNLLCRYAGYINWDDFKLRNSGSVPQTLHGSKGNRLFLIVPAVALFILLALYGIFRLFNSREYRFCFVDADTREAISGIDIRIQVLNPDESPAFYNCSADGCFTIRTDRSKIRMIVASPYYITDTVERILKKFNLNEKIELHADNYALMIRYYSEKNTADWEKRRAQLGKMISDDATIYRVIGSGDSKGMELFSKEEFIDKITLPSGSIRKLQVLNTRYSNGQIEMLCFRTGEGIK